MSERPIPEPNDLPSKGRVAKRKRGGRETSVSNSRTTRENILNAALKNFAVGGFGSGRINRISRAAKSHDRMIYYYFGSKERLFVEVLEKVYSDMWDRERALDFEQLDPAAALVKLAHFTLDYYLEHPEMLAILSSENLHRGKYVSKSKKVRELSSPALALVERIYQRGVEKGAFRKGIRPMHLYLSILSLDYFCVSNRYTLSAYLGADLADDGFETWRAWVADAILRIVRAD